MTALALIVAVLGCAPPPPEPGACAAYAGDADLLAACAMRTAVQMDDGDRAAALCDQLAPARARECRSRWVNAAVAFRPRPSLDTMLRVCGGARDCAFDALDAWPAPTYPEQVAACAEHVPDFVDDCAGHAAQRMLDGGATDAQITEAAAAPHAALLVQMLPNWLARNGRDHCPDIGRYTMACESDLAALRGGAHGPAAADGAPR